MENIPSPNRLQVPGFFPQQNPSAGMPTGFGNTVPGWVHIKNIPQSTGLYFIYNTIFIYFMIIPGHSPHLHKPLLPTAFTSICRTVAAPLIEESIASTIKSTPEGAKWQISMKFSPSHGIDAARSSTSKAPSDPSLRIS